MEQNVNGGTGLLGAAGLIFEFACVLQPNVAQISRCSAKKHIRRRCCLRVAERASNLTNTNSFKANMKI